MRRPIQIQLLLPVLSVVLGAIVLASGASAYLGAVQAHRRQHEDLARVLATLTEPPLFPLTENVLRQMSGLSGAEFVVFDAEDRPRERTLRLAADDVAALARMPVSRELERLSASPVMAVAGQTYLGTRVWLPPRGAATGPISLAILYPESRWWAAVRQAVYPAILTGAVAALAVLVLTTVLARRFVRPIAVLVRQTAAIAQGDFQPVAAPPHDDEIRDLAASINRMTETLSRSEQSVRQNERLRTLGQLGAGMAHQLRNAATGAWMAVELHQRACAGGAASESLAVAIRQLRLMESYLQRFLTLGRPSTGVREKTALEPLVRDVLGLVRPACAHAKIALTYDGCPEPLDARIDPEAIRQVLVNLILNAIEAASRQGASSPRVVVEMRRQPADRVALRIKDSGPGPAAELQEKLFEPFVTEKPDGTGLGLFVARQIAEAHQGTLGWQREDDMTCFTLELPLATAEAGHGSSARG